MAAPARITNSTVLPTNGSAAGLENPMPTVDRSGVASVAVVGDGPIQRANGTYAPAKYKLESGNMRIDY